MMNWMCSFFEMQNLSNRDLTPQKNCGMLDKQMTFSVIWYYLVLSRDKYYTWRIVVRFWIFHSILSVFLSCMPCKMSNYANVISYYIEYIILFIIYLLYRILYRNISKNRIYESIFNRCITQYALRSCIHRYILTFPYRFVNVLI